MMEACVDNQISKVHVNILNPIIVNDSSDFSGHVNIASVRNMVLKYCAG